jgi:NTE family protein
MTKRALILGGGGVVGIAWEVGVLVGLTEAGVDVRNADLFLGTSGGATVAVQLTSGLSMEEVFQRQIDPALQAKELPVQVDIKQFMRDYARAIEGARNTTEALQRIGALALATPTVTEDERLAMIASRLPVQSWSQRRLAIVTVDAHSGERIVFERESGGDLVDVVAASGAVPGIWPPVTIDGHRYIDGGSYSMANADLADGFDRVLVLAPDAPPVSLEKLDPQVELLRHHGAQVEVIVPDEAMKAVLASVGGNPLDPSVRDRAAHAGREQGRSIATRVASLWS